MNTVIAASIDLYSKHVPRCSDRNSFLADTVSKGRICEAALEIIGQESVCNGWKFPRFPQALHEWILNPRIHQSLGEHIIDELEGRYTDWELLNFRKMADSTYTDAHNSL